MQEQLAVRYPDFADQRHVLGPSQRPVVTGHPVTASDSPLTVARPSRISTGFPAT